MSSFKKQHKLAERKEESLRIRTKYTDRVPLIVEKSSNCKTINDIDKHKYLVPNDLTVGQFIYVIRKRLTLPPEMALYLFVAGTIPPTSALIITVYNEMRDEDGFLYLTYGAENCFGF